MPIASNAIETNMVFRLAARTYLKMSRAPSAEHRVYQMRKKHNEYYPPTFCSCKVGILAIHGNKRSNFEIGSSFSLGF
jgi:hypothetical protein